MINIKHYLSYVLVFYGSQVIAQTSLKKDQQLSIGSNKATYEIEKISFNSPFSDFGPSFYENLLVFTSDRDTLTPIHKRVKKWIGDTSLRKLYQVVNTADGKHTKQVVKIGDGLYSGLNESTPAFSADGNTAYFAENNSKNGFFRWDRKGYSRLMLYKAVKRNGKWKGRKALPFSSKSYSIANPALGPKGDKLYFVSDMPGGMGDTDIYVVDINADQSYGKPVNLGPKINTAGKDTFPFVVGKLLYFTSDGHSGNGGLDIYSIDLEDTQATAKNLNSPINSTADDFAFILNSSTGRGYFSSNRKGGIGSDDIYAFVRIEKSNLESSENSETSILEGTSKEPEDIIDSVKNKTVSKDIYATVLKKESTPALIKTKKTPVDFKKSTASEDIIDSAKNKGGSKDVYATVLKKESTPALIKTKEIPVVVKKNTTPESILVAAKAGSNLTVYLNISKVNFDFDRAIITTASEVSLKKISTYLKRFPKIAIEIKAYTDSRGSSSYNLALSRRRALATKTFLVGLGTDAKRISLKGMGESTPLEVCSPCSEKQHRKNRRSEIIVIQ